MHPVLFKIPLPAALVLWGPVALAILLAIYVVTRLLGKEKDVSGAVIGGVLAAAALGFRFVLLKSHPAWLQIGHIPIYSYGVMLGLSLVVGWYLSLGLAEKDGLPKETMANNYVVTALAAVAGSRVLYVLTNLHEFEIHDAAGALDWWASFTSMFAMRRGGLVAYGGFLGGLAGSYFFLKRHRIPLLPWADVAVPSLASGLMITRMGCYMFGCDFGQPLKENAPAILKTLGSFPHWAEGTLDAGSGSPAWKQHVDAGRIAQTATHSLPVHPTQIYESLVGLSLLVLLLWNRRHQKFRGQIFFLFAFAYGVARYMLEILRDDAERGSIPPSLPEHVLIPLGLLVLAAGWVIGFSKAIENEGVRRATQVASFLPAVGVYLALRPETFATSASTQLSTSQFIALTSGFAASVAFAVFYKMALAHPRQAMDLGLPAAPLPAGQEPPAPVAEAPDEDEEERAPVKKPVKKTGKAKTGKAKAKPAPKPADEAETSDEKAEEKKADEKAEEDAGEKEPAAEKAD
jgi:phosphatidylglycerol:prolipoprotein diacylglycerol transferase